MKWYWTRARRLAEENAAKISFLADQVGQINTILASLAKLVESQQKSLDLHLDWRESAEVKSSKIPPGLIMLPPTVAGFLGPNTIDADGTRKERKS